MCYKDQDFSCDLSMPQTEGGQVLAYLIRSHLRRIPIVVPTTFKA
jgi:CheY-like chemotaxis protein